MSQETQYWYLRNHKLFSVLSNMQIEELCIMTKYKKAGKGEIIYFSEDPDQRIYILKKGNIKIVEADNQGNEIIKEILIPGDLLGELTSSNESSTSEYAVALSKEVIICTFRMADFENLLEKNPTIALSYSKLVGWRFKRVRINYSNLVFKDVKTRLRQFFRDWANREGKNIDGHVHLDNYLTHQDIAGMVCSTRQTVTQLMNDLEAEKLIRYSRKEIIIDDVSKL